MEGRRCVYVLANERETREINSVCCAASLFTQTCQKAWSCLSALLDHHGTYFISPSRHSYSPNGLMTSCNSSFASRSGEPWRRRRRFRHVELFIKPFRLHQHQNPRPKMTRSVFAVPQMSAVLEDNSGSFCLTPARLPFSAGKQADESREVRAWIKTVDL